MADQATGYAGGNDLLNITCYSRTGSGEVPKGTLQ